MEFEATPTPVLTLSAQVDCRDFQMGYALLRRNRSPLHLPGVRAGLCLTGAAVCLSLLPTFLLAGMGWLAPALGAGVFLALAAWLGIGAPSWEKSRGASLFATNRTLALPYTLSLYPDGFLLENECETWMERWTQVEALLEHGRYYILRGNLEKPFLVIPKRGMTAGQVQAMTEFFRNELTVRYRRAY